MSTESLQRMLSRVARPSARREFRAQLRRQFSSEAVPARGAATAWLRPMGLAVSVAAVLVIVGGYFNAGPAWRLAGSTGSGVIEVNGRPLELNSPELVRVLRPGARVRLPEGTQLDYELPGTAWVQIVGGSDFRLPGSPGRWFGRSMTASLQAGEVRISTGPAFSGVRLEIATPEARARVTGTTLAVFRQPDATCVCVFEGEVAMLADPGDTTVPAGFRRSVYRDGREPLLEPIRPMETMKLTMLKEQAAKALER